MQKNSMALQDVVAHHKCVTSAQTSQWERRSIRRNMSVKRVTSTRLKV